MRAAVLLFVVKAALCAPGPSQLLVIADRPEFLSASQRQEVERKGWAIERLTVAEGVRLKYIVSVKHAPAVVHAHRVLRVRDGGDVVRLASMLADGKQTFEFACTRCHGDDGNSDTYPNIRKLGGIGARLNTAEITDRLRAVPLGGSDFTVRGHVLSRERLDALVAYVAGL